MPSIYILVFKSFHYNVRASLQWESFLLKPLCQDIRSSKIAILLVIIDLPNIKEANA